MKCSPSMTNLIHRCLRDRSGHFAMMTAITAPMAIVLAAFAVDAGLLYLEKRRAQSLADLAAISAAANLTNPQAAAMTAMVDNGITSISLGSLAPTNDESQGSGLAASEQRHLIEVERGRYTASPALSPTERFVPGAQPYNAARVGYRTFGTRYFAGSLIPEPLIEVSAIASSPAEAAFSVGSRLLSLDGELLNALLGGLTGSGVSLSVMDYNALAAADVSLLSFLDALALEAGLEAGSYREALAAEVTFAQMSRALSRTEGLSGTAKSAASRLAMQMPAGGGPKLSLGRLIDLGTGGQIAQASIEQIGAEIGVLELLTTSAVIAGRGKQVALDLGAGVPGVLAATVSLAIGEPPQHSPWLRVGNGGEIVRTAQTRLALTVEIGGLGGLLGTRIRLPLYLELAFAEARLKSVTCPTGRPDSIRVVVDARPGVADLYLAEVDVSKLGGFANPLTRSPARLVQMPLVGVTGQAHAEISNTTYKSLTFNWNDIQSGKIRQVSTNQIAQSLVQSLFSGLKLDINVAGLGLGLPGNLTGLLGQTIGAAAPAIDGLLNSLLSTLGIALGQADVRVHGGNCGRAVLVQ